MRHSNGRVAISLLAAALAAGLLVATVARAMLPGSSPTRLRHVSLGHAATNAAVVKVAPTIRRRTTGRVLTGFAASFQDYATTAQAGFGGPKVTVRDCVEGGDGTAFCAYTVQGGCHGAMLIEQPLTVKEAGNVGLAAPDCSARHALKWIGSNG